MLAAIVFTDVAGFSRRVQAQEAGPLKLLERDFVTMRAFAAMHAGRVIKSTGDGLLLFFMSAVQAVERALQTQRHFADQAATLAPEEILRHRVGVHLGDVIVTATDVMGDGVNIAARLQAEAPPGGICISQMVYGVVKNKLKLDVIRQEPRQLKNITEAMQIYRVLLEPPVHRAPSAALPKAETAAPPGKSGWGAKKWAGVAIVTVAIVTAAALLLEAHRDHQRTLAGSQDVRDAFAAAMRAGQPASSQTMAPTPALGSTEAPPAAVPPAKPRLDFAQLAIQRRPASSATEEDKHILREATACLPALEAWIPSALERYTEAAPLYVRPLGNPGFKSSTIYSDDKRQIFFVEGGAVRKKQWQDLSADSHAAIVTSLLRSSPVPPPSEVIRGAEAFALVHRIPAMAESLIQERRGR